ncbi:apoptosis-resistant E3 ubiquitin protein ligase 1 isoform X1 [Vespula maculifrons]|uniref:Apoptosis-resistant E3 ubiquitin protein ligase 1 isoform X1 n=1 Tax=Vespula maculifrons TaxID=7453 RepID=A0ABD2AQG9_VESMC
MILSLGKLLMLAAGNGSNGDLTEADQWLAEIGLKQYRPLFRKKVQIEKEQISEVVASEIELVAFVTDSLTNNI